MTASILGVVPAIQALAATLREAIAEADENIRVIVGALGDVEDDDFIMLSAPTEGGAGAMIRHARSDQGHLQSAELDIVVLISTYSAERDIEARMTRAQAMLELFVQQVVDDATLDGTVSVADIGDNGQLSTIDDQHGCAVEIALTVACEIY